MRTIATDTEKRQSLPPYGHMAIKITAAAGQYDEAQAMCDVNHDFYRAKIQEAQDIFIECQREKNKRES